MRVVKAPDYVEAYFNRKIFLAGSIEMGKATPWQDELIAKLEELPSHYSADLVVFNPRRDDWDSSWVQDIDNPQFYEQVTWELNMLDETDIVVFYFDPATQSPITLMELGHLASQDKYAVVCCPEGFWRRGNVQIMCQRYNIPLVNDLDEMFQVVKEFLGQFP